MRQRVVTDTDIALLRSLASERSVVAASQRVGITRDRATYRLAHLTQIAGGAVVRSVRGGRSHGATRLTPLGERLVREGFDSIEVPANPSLGVGSPPNRLRGTYRRGPFPQVDLGRGVRLRVAFDAVEGEPVTVLLAPESILVARGRFATSARNVFAGTVVGVRRRAGSWGCLVGVRVGSRTVRVGVTPESVDQLRLVPGARVWLYVKATALRREGNAPSRPTRGSPRS